MVEPMNASILFLRLHNALRLEGAGIIEFCISVYNELVNMECSGLYVLFSGSVIESTSTICDYGSSVAQ